MTDTSIRQVLKGCFQVGYWLGKAGARESSDNYHRQRELAIDDCACRLQALLGLGDKHEEDKT